MTNIPFYRLRQVAVFFIFAEREYDAYEKGLCGGGGLFPCADAYRPVGFALFDQAHEPKLQFQMLPQSRVLSCSAILID